jgi:ribosomal protein S18 acetylase RimI-like enzyme
MTSVTTKEDTNRSFAKRRKSKQLAAEQSQTVWAATYDLLRSLKLTTFFGNPGSTEETFLKNFPSDFQYILGLQEASAVAMAVGIRRQDVLVATAGEHMRVGGFTEISAVCVEPAYRGHGFASRARQIAGFIAIAARSEIPFLRVFTSNHAAIALYRKLSFTLRRRVHLAVLIQAVAG